MTCSCMTALGLPCSGRKSPLRSAAVPGSTKETQTVASSPIQKTSVRSWRFVLPYKFFLNSIHKIDYQKATFNCSMLNRQNIRKLLPLISGTADWNSLLVRLS